MRKLPDSAPERGNLAWCSRATRSAAGMATEHEAARRRCHVSAASACLFNTFSEVKANAPRPTPRTRSNCALPRFCRDSGEDTSPSPLPAREPTPQAKSPRIGSPAPTTPTAADACCPVPSSSCRRPRKRDPPTPTAQTRGPSQWGAFAHPPRAQPSTSPVWHGPH